MMFHCSGRSECCPFLGSSSLSLDSAIVVDSFVFVSKEWPIGFPFAVYLQGRSLKMSWKSLSADSACQTKSQQVLTIHF